MNSSESQTEIIKASERDIWKDRQAGEEGEGTIEEIVRGRHGYANIPSWRNIHQSHN